ncbi:UNVERIFIED_CONTAM: protein WVD2-like 7 [Sesamum radiatum]|uniref:Protein WVD2-like 7 n=1 Tax=Sesamum radiatum TaxID=300843 RepID=A0AAW2RBR4_SESRA
MDPGVGVGVSSAFEDGIREKDGPTPRVDADVEQTSEAPNFSCDAEVAFVHVDASLSQEASSADKDGMDIDSESTYSCLDGSSDENSVDSDGENGYTSQNGSSIDHHSLNKDTENGCWSPKTFSGSGNNGPNIVGKQNDQSPGLSSDNQLGMDADDKHVSQTSEAPSSPSSGSGQVIKDEAGEYVVPKLGLEFESEDHAYKCYNRYALMEGFSIRKDFVNRTHLLPSQKRISFVEAVEAESAVTPVPDGVPKLGMGFESEDHAYEFYNAYAGRVGFSVRKDYVNRSKVDGAVASRRYTCFREGYRQKDKRGLKVKRPRKETRVGCMAQLVISRQADGRYRVTHFEERHNHELVPACKVRMLRSQKRSMTDQIVESTASGGSNVQPKSLAELLLTGVGIQDFIYDPIDHETRLTSKRVWNIKPDEPESIHQYFQSKKLKDPSFFYAVQCDWLFRTFKRAMSGKTPKTIVSDKDAVISEAMISELPETHHSLKKYLKPESHVLQFIKHIGKVVNDWRYKELEANYDMGQHMPRLMGDVIMLKQVREVYTPVIFKTFHQEYENCLNIVINQCIDTVSSVEYKVSTYGQVRQYTVLYSSEDDSVACSCMKFHNSSANRMGDSACVMHGFSYASALPNESKLGNPMHALGDSISFGRFMTESLSWEKWSTFSHKKYVEEAERYAQPGSVAQKKAFFEAHYKRIAARKAAALLEQENAAKITEAEGVGDNNAYDEKGVILNSHPDVDVKIEEVKIQEDTKKDSVVDVHEHGLIAAVGIGREEEHAVIPETEASNEKRNSVNQLDNLGNEDMVSVSGTQKLERPSLKISVASADIPSLSSNENPGLSLLKISIQDKPWKIPSTPAKPVTPHPKENENNVPQSTTKSSVDKKGASPNSLLSLMNLVPIEVPDKKPVSATMTTEISGLACSTPLRTPLKAASKGESTHPAATPLSESRRTKTTIDPLAPGSKTTAPKWNVLSAITRPLPHFNKETEAPETHMEKTPAAQPDSAVLGRSGLDKRQGTISMPPPPPPPACLAKNVSRKKVHNPSKFLANSLPDGITHENASPNIQQ